MFYYAARDVSLEDWLRDELRVDFSRSRDPQRENAELAELPLLNGVINECLRLEPAVGPGGLKKTPPEGPMVGDVFIHGNVDILSPQCAIHRGIDSTLSFSLPRLEAKDLIVFFADGPRLVISKRFQRHFHRVYHAWWPTEHDLGPGAGDW